ncbi:MAG: Flp pilus assembly complex ATPase component TadA [Deltaproteobacteria bacterium]|nr:Flp pilus assembly complex ATPase component TadA [Deltaproteobacteria bacterium]
MNVTARQTISLVKNEVLLDKISPESEQAPAVRMQRELLEEAIRLRASDIHIEPSEKTVRIRYRIDGRLRNGSIFPRSALESLVSRYKISCNLDISEKRIPQDGSFRVQYQGKAIDLRVSLLPTMWGEKVVIRILDTRQTFLGVDQLGFPLSQLERLSTMIERPQGLILVVGPTGSGKTTTLYSILQAIHREGINIITVEDPIEYALEGVTQVQVYEKVGLTFANTLRSILRQDPDVILVGEIRDEETAQIALRAAFTGHLVLSTLHTNDAVSTITRLYNLGLEPYVLSSCLLGILSQRLIRKNCSHCREPYSPDPGILERYHLHLPKEEIFYQGKGCSACRGQGYEGREGFFELLTVTPAFREAIQVMAPETELRHLAVQEGMETLLACGLRKAREGQVSLEEMMRIIPYEVGARYCPACFYPVEHFFANCPNCSRQLILKCSGCGKRLQASWKACPYCGKAALTS